MFFDIFFESMWEKEEDGFSSEIEQYRFRLIFLLGDNEKNGIEDVMIGQ